VTLTPKLAIIAVVLLAVGCGGGGKSTASATTTTAAGTATTSTVEPPPSTVGGTDDASVAMRLYDVATAEDTLYVDAGKFTNDLTMLASIEPSITYGSGLTPPTNPAAINVAISADAQWACLIGRSAVGHLLVEAVGAPPGNAYTGNAVLTACNAASVQRMKRVNG